MKRLACSVLIAFALLASACMRDNPAPMNDPDIPTMSVDAETLTRISATLAGSFGKADGIVSYGFEMTGTNFDDGQETVIEVSGLDEDGRFYHTAEVQPGAYYAVRSFISDGHNRKYSEVLSLNVPRSSAATPSEVSIVNDRLYASIVDDGGRTIREAGFCWGETPDSKTIRLSRLKARMSDDGTFSADLPEMQPGRTYYFLAYLENAAGSDEAFGYSRNPGTYFVSEEELPVEIEDHGFFLYLLGRFDSDKDGKLTRDELKVAADISVSTDQIASLQGIEYMPLLTSLDCRGSSPGKGRLESVDISRNPLLSSFLCANNRLAALDLSAADRLVNLDCSGNRLEHLDLSGCFRLVDLDCSDNMLSELDVTGLPYLRRLSFRSNPVESVDISFCSGLENLDGTDCPQLRWVYLSPGQYEDEKMLGSCLLDETAIFYPVYIPIQDDNLYRYVVSQYDKDGDGRISAQEAAAVSRIDVCTDNVGSMSGIELFYNLEELICRSCNTMNPAGQLSTLDVSHNHKLTYLDCSGNSIDKLNLSLNGGLTTLICDNNLLEELDFSGCSGLELLRCSGNRLKSLDVSALASLKSLDCSGNQLSVLDVSHNPLLKELNLGRNAFSKLDLSGCTALESLDCSSNGFETLDVSGLASLTELKCSHNKLESLDVSGLAALETLWCEDNGMTWLDLTGNRNLADVRCDNVNIPDAAFKEYLVSVYDRNGDGEISLDEAWNIVSIEMDTQRTVSLEGIQSFGNLQRLICSGGQSGGQLTSLDLTGNRRLTYLDCSGNQLKSLDVTGLASLEALDCSGNQLSSLDVSGNPLLKELNLGGNAFASLDLSGCTALESLDCSSNGLKALDLSGMALLSELKCSHNKIEVLDISDNAGLKTLWCENNSMTWLDVTANNELADIRCDNIEIPDAAFKAYLVSLYDTNSDGEISLVEAWDVRRIEVGTRNIASVEGIGSFINLNVLICSDDEAGGQLSELNLTSNRKLTYLDCRGNRIAGLDLSQNEGLTSLICDDNLLTALDVSGSSLLGRLKCSGNRLKSLDVSGLESLSYLDCSGNDLTDLFVARNVMLKELYLVGNRVGSLNLTRCTGLEILDCSSNRLEALELSGLSGLLNLKCSDNMLESLNISGSSGLKTLWCEDNSLLWLDVTANKELVDIRCDNVDIPDAAFKAHLVSVFDTGGDGEISLVEAWDVKRIEVGTQNIGSLDGIRSFWNLHTLVCTGGANQRGGLTSLDLSQNPKLIKVDCRNNQIVTLAFSMNRILKDVLCSGNAISNLDVSMLPGLNTLDCSENRMDELDVSHNSELRYLSCQGMSLSDLDVTGNVRLTELYCSRNALKKLDLSNNVYLERLDCSSNHLFGTDTLSTGLIEVRSLDVSKSTSLAYLNCMDNGIPGYLHIFGGCADSELLYEYGYIYIVYED